MIRLAIVVLLLCGLAAACGDDKSTGGDGTSGASVGGEDEPSTLSYANINAIGTTLSGELGGSPAEVTLLSVEPADEPLHLSATFQIKVEDSEVDLYGFQLVMTLSDNPLGFDYYRPLGWDGWSENVSRVAQPGVTETVEYLFSPTSQIPIDEISGKVLWLSNETPESQEELAASPGWEF